MFHQHVKHAVLSLIFNPALFFRINLPVSAISISADTLRAIEKDHVYKFGYDKSAKHHNQPHYYSLASSVGLVRLSQLEQEIKEAVQRLILDSSHENSQLKQSVKEYMEDYTATTVALANSHNVTQDAVKATQVVAGNLIGAYRMARRFRHFIQPWMVALSSINESSLSQSELDFLDTITSLKSGSRKQGPFRRDFHLTMIAIILTQFQLEWKAEDIAKGAIEGMELGVTLRAVHCFEIGVHAVASLMYPIGIEWLQLALLKTENGDDSMEPGSILVQLEKAKHKHDLNWKPQNGVELEDTFYQVRLNETTEEPKWQRKTQADPHRLTKENDLERSWDACSGKLQKSELEKSELFCWYETKVDRTWRIRPLKVELHSRFPLEILQFHDVIGEGRIEGVKDTCEDYFQSSPTAKTDLNLYPKPRLSQTCFRLDQSPVHAQLLQLTQRITGMSSMKGEEIQVSSYPPGGHIRAHIDKRRSPYSYNERLATLIYYFDGPSIGGKTAFPMANVAIKTFKGSAIFWFSRLKSSEVDEDAVHLSCPVVQGQKWIGIHWIQYHHQEHWVCDRDENSRAEYPVNGKSKYLGRKQK